MLRVTPRYFLWLQKNPVWQNVALAKKASQIYALLKGDIDNISM